MGSLFCHAKELPLCVDAETRLETTFTSVSFESCGLAHLSYLLCTKYLAKVNPGDTKVAACYVLSLE